MNEFKKRHHASRPPLPRLKPIPTASASMRGNQTLGAMVAGFADNERGAEQRIAGVHRLFTHLESIRDEIADALTPRTSRSRSSVSR